MFDARRVSITLGIAMFIGAAISMMPAIAETSEEGAATPTPASTDTSTVEKRPFWKDLTIEPSVSTYIPNSGKLRDRFGSSWTSLGVSLAMKGNKEKMTKMYLHWDSIRRESSGSHAYICPVGLTYRTQIAGNDSTWVYAGAGANLYFVDLLSIPDRVDTGFRTTPGLSALIGARVSSRVRVEMTYYTVADVKGFDLGGLNLSASVKF